MARQSYFQLLALGSSEITVRFPGAILLLKGDRNLARLCRLWHIAFEVYCEDTILHCSILDFNMLTEREGAIEVSV